MKKLLLTSLLSLGLTSGLFADNIVLSSVNGGGAIGSTFVNFDSLALGNGAQSTGGVNVWFTGSGQVVQGTVSNQYAAPFLSGNNGVGFGSPDQPDGADTTKYLSAGTGTVTLDFGSAQKYLGLLWGSVDNYNSLWFYNGASLVGTFTGVDVWAAANGNQGAAGTFYVNFNDLDGAFTKIVLGSTINSFEIDNVAFDSSNHVPDSSSSVLLVGLGLIGLAALRRKS